MVMVGNKLDLDDQRAVSPQEGQELAAAFGCAWMETSAKVRGLMCSGKRPVPRS